MARRPLPLSVAMCEVLVEDLDVGSGISMSPAVTSAGPRTSRRQRDRLVASRREHDVLEVEDDVGDVLGDAGDGVELVERVVEADRRDGRAGDRRQQGAAQRVAERVAEAGLERADGEPLTVVVSSPMASTVGRCMTSMLC